MTSQRFRVVPIRSGKNLIVPVPFDPNEVWGMKGEHFITGTVGGFDVRGALGKGEAGAILTLGPAWQKVRPIPDGEVEVVLAPEGPQIPLMAEDIQAAFEGEPEARAFFESLATFYRKGFIDPIEGAKRPATRTAKITEMIELLRERKREKGK